MPAWVKLALKIALRWLKSKLLEELKAGIRIKLDDYTFEIRLIDSRERDTDGKSVLLL